MLVATLSPSKTLNSEPPGHKGATLPQFQACSQKLVNLLKTYDEKRLAELMNLSPKLARLNYERFQKFVFPHDGKNAAPALMTYQGDVYRGINWQSYDEKEFDFAQDHLCILSGLYGVLRPLDLIQPYRLEMGTRLQNEAGKNLYLFWQKQVAELFNQLFESSTGGVIVNLASQEYAKVLDRKAIKVPTVDVHFKEKKGDDYKIIGIYAKYARGLMADYIVKNGLQVLDDLKGFDRDGYRFSASRSNSSQMVFLRDQT